MDDRAILIVSDYMDNKGIAYSDIFIVWKCKTLQNWKYIISSNAHDQRIYEVTYNGDKKEFYLDVYNKEENRCITM